MQNKNKLKHDTVLATMVNKERLYVKVKEITNSKEKEKNRPDSNESELLVRAFRFKRPLLSVDVSVCLSFCPREPCRLPACVLVLSVGRSTLKNVLTL